MSNRRDIFRTSIAHWLGALVALLAPAAHALAQPDEQARQNLGRAVNSASEDNGPVISPDGRTLYFQREVPSHVRGLESDFDIYYSTLDSNGDWSVAQPLPAPVNSPYRNGLIGVLADGNTLFLDYRYNRMGVTSAGFSTTHRTPDGWSQPEPIEVDNFTNTNQFVNAAVAGDGRTLLLGIETEESFGDQDLYVSFLLPNGHYSTPMNLGAELNTKGVETSPFLASDGMTLYFATDARGGSGGLDIFVTRRLDSTWRHWSPPVNLGPGINTADFDAYYTAAAAGDYAYLVSYEHSFGRSDIFRVRLPKSVQPKPVALVSGIVRDAATKRPIAAHVRCETIPAGNGGPRFDTAATSAFRVTLPAGARYQLHAEADGYYPATAELDLSGTTAYTEESIALELSSIAVGSTIRLNNIFFASGSAELEPASYPELDRVAALLVKYPSMQIDIAGHTDSVGPDETNMLLSIGRAKAVFEYLSAHDIAIDRLGWAGYGEEMPVAPNDTEEGRRLNRRVEFTIRRR